MKIVNPQKIVTNNNHIQEKRREKKGKYLRENNEKKVKCSCTSREKRKKNQVCSKSRFLFGDKSVSGQT